MNNLPPIIADMLRVVADEKQTVAHRENVVGRLIDIVRACEAGIKAFDPNARAVPTPRYKRAR